MSQSSLRSVSHIDAVEQNGLWIARGYESLLEAHGIDSLEALAAYGGGERLDKLGLANRVELAAFAARHHFGAPGPGE